MSLTSSVRRVRTPCVACSYHSVVSTLLSHSPAAHVLIATHNESSVRRVVALM